MTTQAIQKAYIEHKIANKKIWMPLSTANFIDTVEQINRQFIRPDEGLLVAPHTPIFYPILQRKSPLRDIYFLFPETENEQIKSIAKLQQEHVNWVILGDIALDNRDELRFKNTHPLLWRHFVEHFKVVEGLNLPANYQLLHRK